MPPSQKTVAHVLLTVAWLSGCAASNGSSPNSGARDRGGSDHGSNGSGGTSSAGADNSNSSNGSTSCGPGCQQEAIGQGGQGFDLEGNPHDDVAIDRDGALVIARDDGDQVNKFIWIANSGDNQLGRGTVSKVDTTSMKEVARYVVGAIDPSRTSVAMNGDAYVGSRAGAGLTKISALGGKCPDTNGDGSITTSSGPGQVLPWGQDDCVLWFKPLQELIRGVAAQDIPGTTTVERAPDREPVVTTTPVKHYVWTGGMSRKLYKLDGDTGAVLIEMTAPIGIYGLALDGRGKLWMTNASGLAFVDTKKCTDSASCAIEPCRLQCDAMGCATGCDDATAATIALPDPRAYGITVDCKQRVWLSGWLSTIKRYDPSAPPAQRFAQSTGFEARGVTGIATDSKGFVWGGKLGVGIVRLNAEDLSQAIVIPLSGGARGVAIDADGKVWGVPPGPNAHVVDPGAELSNNTVAQNVVSGLVAPYTYSDMTGQQLRFATDEPSTYRKRFEGCAGGNGTTWESFHFDVETPADTSLIFRARTAPSPAGLDTSEWIVIGGLPDWSTSPLSLKDALIGSGLQNEGYLDVELQLKVDDQKVADRCNGVAATTPRVKSFGVGFSCGPIVL